MTFLGGLRNVNDAGVSNERGHGTSDCQLCHATDHEDHRRSTIQVPVLLFRPRPWAVAFSVKWAGQYILVVQTSGVKSTRLWSRARLEFAGYVVGMVSRVAQSVSGYWLDDREIEVRSPAEAKDFSSNLCVQTGSGAHPAYCTMGTGILSPEVKRGRGVTLTTRPMKCRGRE
jgi:hypothetical protein